MRRLTERINQLCRAVQSYEVGVSCVWLAIDRFVGGGYSNVSSTKRPFVGERIVRLWVASLANLHEVAHPRAMDAPWARADVAIDESVARAVIASALSR